MRIKNTAYWTSASYSWHEFGTKGDNIQSNSLQRGIEMLHLSFGDNSFPLCEQLVIEGGKM